MSDIRDGKSAERQASEWLVLMEAGEPSLEDRARFETWLEHPVHGAVYAELEATWARLHAIGEHTSAVRGPAEREALVDARRRRSAACQRGQRWTAWAAAAAVAAIVALVGAARLYPLAFEMQYSTVVGERSEIVLPDGSVVELNTGTELSVTYSSTLRHVALRRGEAHFDVTLDVSRPFVVAAGPGTIRAVGTGFVVRLLSEEAVSVTVTEGVVQLAHADRSPPEPKGRVFPADRAAPTLTRGQHAELDPVATWIKVLPPDELARSHAWRQGMLIFHGQSLHEVIQEVERYTDVQLVIADNDLNALRIGGAFRAGDVEALLEVLQKSFDISVLRRGSRTIYLHATSASETGHRTELKRRHTGQK